MEFSLLHSLVVSISLGALIGLIRQWADQHSEEKPEPAAGLRTYSLWSLLGFLAAYLNQGYIPHFFAITFALLGVFLVVASAIENSGVGRAGYTSYALALLTFIVGGLIFWQQWQISIAVAATLVILIAVKPTIHRWTRKLTQEDIQNLLQFIAVTGLILPLVPNEGFGPFDAFNPYKIWLMVVLIAGLGFAGYVAMRLLGARAGIAVTGFVGGIASSTATTFALTRNSRANPELSGTLATGIIIANAVMVVRIAAILLALNIALFKVLLLPLAVMGAPAVLYVLYELFVKKSGSKEVDTPAIRNPLSLKMAIQFGVLYALVVFFVKAAGGYGGGVGFYPIAFLSGLTSMDAIALSLTNMQSEGSLVVEMAARGILLGAIANTLFKMGFALSFGGSGFRLPVVIGTVPMLLTGIGAMFLI